MVAILIVVLEVVSVEVVCYSLLQSVAVVGSQWQSATVNCSKWLSILVNGSINFIQLITNISLSAAGAKADCALPTILS